MVFIVQGKPRSPDGILKVIKETRQEAMQAATDLLENGMAFVTIIADGCVYTVEEFSLTILAPHDGSCGSPGSNCQCPRSGCLDAIRTGNSR